MQADGQMQRLTFGRFIRPGGDPSLHRLDRGATVKPRQPDAQMGVRLLATLKDGTLDPSVGVTEIRKVGTQVKQGEPLIMIHYNDEAKVDAALPYFRDAYRLAPKLSLIHI